MGSIRINLTHVRARVVGLDVGHVQLPRVVPVVSDRQPWIVRDHVRMNGQDSFGVRLYPGNLYNTITDIEISPFQRLIRSCGLHPHYFPSALVITGLNSKF